jgi:hypothetical protein
MRTSQYVVSLPERVLRSVALLAAGLIREIGNLALPAGVRKTRLYKTMIESTLRFLIEQVGEIEGAYPSEDKLAERFLLKRALGDGIDVIGMIAFHASPVWVLAALADVSGAGRQLMDEITTSLKDEGLLDGNANFETVDKILDGLERTGGQLATSIRFPPLDIAGLRKDWADFKEAARTIPLHSRPSPELMRGQWEALKAEAAAQHRTVFELASLVALSTVRAVPENLTWLSRCARTATSTTGHFFAAGLLSHYDNTLKEIHEVGYLAYWTREFRPYLLAAAKQFSKSHLSLTERLLDRNSRRVPGPAATTKEADEPPS